MADNNSSSDSDNVLISDDNKELRISACNAATQTPELPRHKMASMVTKTSTATETTIEPSQSSSIVVLQMGNEKEMSDFEREAKALSIPEVVVEFIKDSCANKDDKGGYGNPAFDSQEVLIRVPSRSSLREDSKSDASSLNLHLASTSDRSVGSEDELLPLGSQNPRLYYSMPRKTGKKGNQQDIQLHSQPSSPKMQRLNVSNQMETSASLLSLLQQNGGNFVLPPSPNFGYRPLESETSAVYTIIKTCVNTNALKEIHFLPALESTGSTPKAKRKFEYTRPPPNIERIRRRLQLCTDSFSIMFLLPAILLALLTPILIIPMFIYPLEYFLESVGYFLASGTLSICILALSGLIGNTVWHYNESTRKLRPRIHCGRGPLLHFWSGSFYYSSDDAKAKTEKEFIV